MTYSYSSKIQQGVHSIPVQSETVSALTGHAKLAQGGSLNTM